MTYKGKSKKIKILSIKTEFGFKNRILPKMILLAGN